jgi:hypothetical protein
VSRGTSPAYSLAAELVPQGALLAGIESADAEVPRAHARCLYGSGITQIDRFRNVAVPLSVLYIAVKVVLPALKPLRTNDALAFWKSLPTWFSAVESSVGAATVLAPLIVNDMNPLPLLLLVSMPAVTEMSTRPDAGTAKVTAGPTVAKLV